MIMASEIGAGDLTPAQRETLAFVEQMTGWTISTDPPPAGSPLARMIALSDARDAGRITAEECVAAQRRIQQASLAEAIRNGEEPF